MKIKRIIDGQEVEIELTGTELSDAHSEYELENAVEDIKGIYQQSDCEIEFSDDQLEAIAERAIHNLGKNDMYWDTYWSSFNDTFDEYINGLIVEEE